jgi:hypothetical protein
LGKVIESCKRDKEINRKKKKELEVIERERGDKEFTNTTILRQNKS